MFRRMLRLTSPIGRPATQLEVGHSGGRYLYITAAQQHVAIAVGLDPAQVEQLVAAGQAWLSAREQDATPFGRPFSAEQSAV